MGGTVHTLDSLTSEHLTRWLNTPVEGPLVQRAIGAGQVARCIKVSSATNDHAGVIVKIPSSDHTSRESAARQHLYRKEVGFYTRLASLVDIATPQCFVADYDDATDDFCLILEDVGPSDAVSQFDGLGLEVARAGLTELARLHGPLLRDGGGEMATWLQEISEHTRPYFATVLSPIFDAFLTRYVDRLSPEVRDMVIAVQERLPVISQYQPPRPTICHGDFRTDNLLINARGGRTPVVAVDWQTLQFTSPLLDVAYFLTTSLDAPTFAQWGDDLLSFYCAQLARYEQSYDEGLARREFARYTLQPIVMLVAASIMVEQTTRGDDMFFTMIERGVSAATQWRALEEVDRGLDS
jgi:thiamine kinase-like enzyme